MKKKAADWIVGNISKSWFALSTYPLKEVTLSFGISFLKKTFYKLFDICVKIWLTCYVKSIQEKVFLIDNYFCIKNLRIIKFLKIINIYLIHHVDNTDIYYFHRGSRALLFVVLEYEFQALIIVKHHYACYFTSSFVWINYTKHSYNWTFIIYILRVLNV